MERIRMGKDKNRMVRETMERRKEYYDRKGQGKDKGGRG